MPTLNSRYLNLAELRRLRHVVFASRRVVEGQYAGRHATPQRGHSVEFRDYRSYIPGDDINDVDWKVLGRSDRLYVKLFEHQADMTVNLLVDASASMAYGGPRRPQSGKGSSPVGKAGPTAQQGEPSSKFDHACRIAAAIAFLVVKQQDKVSLGLARDGLADFLRAGSSIAQVVNILGRLEAAAAERESNLADALVKMAPLTPRRGLLIVVSDLLDEPEPIHRALSLYTHRGSEVIVFHVMHADELDLPPLHDTVFVDSESRQRLRLNVDDVRPAYEKRLRAFLDQWATSLRARGIDYNLVSTATPYHKALEHYLFTRARA